jgi:hypothetical protein
MLSLRLFLNMAARLAACWISLSVTPNSLKILSRSNLVSFFSVLKSIERVVERWVSKSSMFEGAKML